MTRHQVLDRLRGVTEPCSIAMRTPIDIVEMGLVEDIAIDDEGRVRITLCLTDPGCVHMHAMSRYIDDVLSDLDGVASVTVDQTRDKLWTPERSAVHGR